MNHLISGIKTTFVVLCVICAVALVGPRIAGFTPFVVLSGSMEPTYPVGSLIYVKGVDPADLTVGDPVTFVMNEEGSVATHRIIAIDQELELLYTQGDANNSPDGQPVLFSNIIGTPVFCIPYAGYVTAWISQPPGLFIAIGVVAILLIWSFMPSRKLNSSAKKPPLRQSTSTSHKQL